MAERLLALSFCVHMLFTTKVAALSLLRSELWKKNFHLQQSFRSWPPRRSESLAHCCSRSTACIMPSEAEQAKWRLQHISSYSCAQAIDILTNTCTCIQHCLWGSNATAISSGRHQSLFSCVFLCFWFESCPSLLCMCHHHLTRSFIIVHAMLAHTLSTQPKKSELYNSMCRRMSRTSMHLYRWQNFSSSSFN